MSKCPHLKLTDPESFRDGIPRDFYKAMRREEPLFWQDDPDTGVGHWVVTKRDHLDFVSKNPQLFSSAARSSLPQEMRDDQIEQQKFIMLNMDPPDHLKYRRIVNKAFVPKVVESKLSHIRELAKAIIDKVAHKGRCEFVSEVAAELPLQVICELMGVDQEDRHMIFETTNIMIGADDPDLSTSEEDGVNASMEIYMYGYKLLETHRTNPEQYDDLVSMLIDGTVDGEHLSDDEFAAFFLLLIVAGNETTRTVTANGMKLLIEHPDQLQELVDNPSLIPNAVEEILRHEPAVMQFRRTAMEDVELDGKLIKKGDKVLLEYPSANCDEQYFESPEEFNIHRKDAKEHRTFGIGEHFCLGSHLARLELQVMFEEIIPRLRNPKLDGPPNRLRSFFLNSTKEMWITFDPEQSEAAA